MMTIMAQHNIIFQFGGILLINGIMNVSHLFLHNIFTLNCVHYSIKSKIRNHVNHTSLFLQLPNSPKSVAKKRHHPINNTCWSWKKANVKGCNWYLSVATTGSNWIMTLIATSIHRNNLSTIKFMLQHIATDILVHPLFIWACGHISKKNLQIFQPAHDARKKEIRPDAFVDLKSPISSGLSPLSLCFFFLLTFSRTTKSLKQWPPHFPWPLLCAGRQVLQQ